jgi:hypothetical protein
MNFSFSIGLHIDKIDIWKKFSDQKKIPCGAIVVFLKGGH